MHYARLRLLLLDYLNFLTFYFFSIKTNNDNRLLHILFFFWISPKKCSTKQLFCTSGQNLCEIPVKEIIFGWVAGLNYNNIWNCTTKELLYRCFSIFLTINGSQNRTFIFVENIAMATSHLLILNYRQKRNWSYFLNYLLTYLLTDFIRAPSLAILSKFAGLKYHKYLSRSSLCYTILSYPILCCTILYLA